MTAGRAALLGGEGPEAAAVRGHPRGAPMAESVRVTDLAVVGAGPAGVEAAVTAAGYGLDVVLLDELPAAGGQVHRAAPAAFPRNGGGGGGEAAAGDALRARLDASSVEVRTRERVWSVVGRADLAPSSTRLAEEAGFPAEGAARFRLDTLGAGGVRSVFATRLVLCPGAVERVVPFPGWTLPGVMGLAAATILLKSQRLLPGRRVVVAGAGPLVPAVAAGILEKGGAVVAIVDLNGPSEWVGVLPRLATMPRLAARGVGWFARIAGGRVPILFRCSIRRAAGRRRLETVTAAPIDRAGRWRERGGERTEREFEADALVVGHGLSPATEIGRLLRIEHEFDRARGGWRPITDEWGRTSVPGCYAAGDGAGVLGAAAASRSGRMAGTAAALDAGRIAPDAAAGRVRRLRRARARAARFGAAMARLMAPRPGMVEGIPADTLVCRCEDVTRRDVEDAIAEGAAEVNQLKHFTRCGMGPCQGRVCGDTAAELLAARIAADPDEGRRAAGQWTGRAPLRPAPLDALAGRFDYEDLPMPPPAPP